MHDFTCKNCGESRYDAVRKQGIHEGYCFNCTYRGDRYSTCFTCSCLGPYEMHHIIPRRLGVDTIEAKTLVPLCLNCHRCLTCEYERHLWTYKQIGANYGMQAAIDDAKEMLFAMYEERRKYYEQNKRANYAILARAYRESILAEYREKQDTREFRNHQTYSPNWSELV